MFFFVELQIQIVPFSLMFLVSKWPLNIETHPSGKSASEWMLLVGFREPVDLTARLHIVNLVNVNCRWSN